MLVAEVPHKTPLIPVVHNLLELSVGPNYPSILFPAVRYRLCHPPPRPVAGASWVTSCAFIKRPRNVWYPFRALRTERRPRFLPIFGR